MENRYKRLLLGALCCVAGAAPVMAGGEPPREVIRPDIERRDVNPAAIDSEDFEVGLYGGLLSIQDFDSEVVYGLRAAWHVTEDFFFELSYGSSEGDLTSYEELSGGAPLFNDSERDYEFYDLTVGWNALPGEIFLFGNHALKSDLYLIGGAGSTEFLDDRWFTATVGAGYRLLLNDWLALRLDVRDHIYDRDTFGDSEVTHNIEISSGFTVFF